MLRGASAEDACSEAGFKGHPATIRGGAISAMHRFAQALRRVGIPVVSIRGRWAQPIDDRDKAQISRELRQAARIDRELR